MYACANILCLLYVLQVMCGVVYVHVVFMFMLFASLFMVLFSVYVFIVLFMCMVQCLSFVVVLCFQF